MDILFIALLLMLALGTAILVFWIFLLFKADTDHEEEAAHFAFRNYNDKYLALIAKYDEDTEALESLEGLEYFFRKLLHNPISSEKKADKIKKSMDKLESGNYSGINFLVLPGYGLLEMFNVTGNQRLFLTIVKLYSDLKGREYAVQNTRYLLAAMGSLAIGGSGAVTVLGVLLYAIGNQTIGFLLAFGGAIFSVLLAYVLYEDVKGKSKARKTEIMVDFAQVVTEIALLTSSGMEMFRAWDEVCRPPERNGALFKEMRQTSAEINNGFRPNVALEGFIKRCGTKDTTRLGASIMQNLTRGNDELSIFLTELSQDVWADRKNNAKKLGEQARSKLMLPMIMIFFGIILLVGVPIFLGIGNMGF